MLLLVLEGAGLTAVVAWVFYDSVLGMAAFPVVFFFNYKRYLGAKAEKWQKQFGQEYKELLLSVSGSLQTGYSVENAFREAENNLLLLYGENGILVSDIRELNGKVGMRIPVEQAFLELSEKYSNEELTGFAEVFRFAKRLGGDYVKNIRRSAQKIEEKIDLSQEIEAAIAEKQFELKAMMVMPAGILAYMKLSSPAFLEPVYHNAFGVAVMSGCIAAYLGSAYLGKKIVDIKV